MCCLLACYLRWAVLCPCVCFCIRSHPFSSIICSRNCFSFCPSTLIFSFTGLFQSAKRQAIISTMLKKRLIHFLPPVSPYFWFPFAALFPERVVYICCCVFSSHTLSNPFQSGLCTILSWDNSLVSPVTSMSPDAICYWVCSSYLTCQQPLTELFLLILKLFLLCFAG